MSMHNGLPRQHPDYYHREEPEPDVEFIELAQDEVYDLLCWGERGDVSFDELQTQLENVGTDFTIDLIYTLDAADHKFRGALNESQIADLKAQSEDYVRVRARELETEFWKE